MALRVCIPAAGIGSRLSTKTKFINKALVSINHCPVICNLIGLFPHDTEFVLALGYKGHLIREFLALAYPDRRFLFADVELYEGEGSGLGLSLLKCERFLQKPFIFIACDTLVKEPIPNVDENWMGYADDADGSAYRVVEVHAGNVSTIDEKREVLSPNHKPYIGLAGIKDYQIFWQALHAGGDTAIAQGEAYGLRHLLQHGIKAHSFSWFDTGTPEALEKTKEAYATFNQTTILEKENEAIWFVGGNVIKFSNDPLFIANRVKRAAELAGYIPEITGAQNHMYRYTKIEGDVLSDIVTISLFQKLLEYCTTFWTSKILNTAEQQRFEDHCLHFYQNKTYERVRCFFVLHNKTDSAGLINGVEVPPLQHMLERLDWAWLSKGLPSRFHGDFHFENIIWDKNKQRFTFLDWRQDFDGLLDIGDRYYDLAKLLHGLIINHKIIEQEKFNIQWDQEKIFFDFERLGILAECEIYLYKWLTNNGYDTKKVRVLTALIFLNIAPLHHKPYCFLLYALGKLMLFEYLV